MASDTQMQSHLVETPAMNRAGLPSMGHSAKGGLDLLMTMVETAGDNNMG